MGALAIPSIRMHLLKHNCDSSALFQQIQVQLLNHIGNFSARPVCATPESFRALLVLVNNVIDDSVLLTLLRVHDEVAFHVSLDLFQQLAGVLGEYLVGDFAHA